jgi:MFS family permease
MLTHYRAAFRAKGTAAFASAGFVMRFPTAIYPLGLVLIASSRTGHYAFAGALAGIWTAANGVGNPVLARVVDRVGQGRVIIPATSVHIVAAVVLGVLVHTEAADWTLVPVTIVSGFTYLSVGSMVRARWSYVYSGTYPGVAESPAELSTAYSLESALDEVIYTVGPLLASVLAIQIYPLSVLVACVVLIGVGALWLREQRATEPPSLPEGAPPHPSPLRSRGMVLLCIAAAGMGAMFASAEVTMVAFCGQHGQRGASGLAMGALACGSAIAGFTYGARHWKKPVLDRFRIHAVTFGILPILFFAATNVPTLILCALIVGLGIAPLAITSFGLIENLVPAESLTEGLAWLITGVSVGYGAGSALVGGIADEDGARSAFSVTVVAGWTVLLFGLILHRRLRRAARELALEPEPIEAG